MLYLKLKKERPYLFMFFLNKFSKKSRLILCSILFLIIFLIVIGIIIKIRNHKNDNNMKKIKIATALETTRAFLEDNLKPELKKDNIDLEVIYKGNSYRETNQLLQNDKDVIAILDSHLVFAKNTLQKSNNSMSEDVMIAQPFYLSKIGFYTLDARILQIQNQIQSQIKINNITDLQNAIINLLTQNQPNQVINKIKILVCSDPIQKVLSFLFLQQMGLIHLKQGLQADNVILNPNDFIIPNHIEIVEEISLKELHNKFQNDNSIHFFINYPGVLGTKKQLFKLFTSLIIPSDIKNPIYDYTISLIVKTKDINSEKVKILKEALRKQHLIDYMNKRNSLYLEMIPVEKMDQISERINQKYNS